VKSGFIKGGGRKRRGMEESEGTYLPGGLPAPAARQMGKEKGETFLRCRRDWEEKGGEGHDGGR